MIDSQTIPAWFVAATMILTGLMWTISMRRNIRVDMRSFSLTFILEGLVFMIAYQIFSVDIELRGFISRLMISILSLSQFIPLAVAYYRSLHK